MTRKQRVILLVGTLVGVGVLLGALVVLTSYVRAVRTWSDDQTFGSKVADGAASAVADGVMQALARVDQELAEICVGRKGMTADELGRLRDLYRAGEYERARALLSRYTDQELTELQQKLDDLAQRPREKAP